jgi:hypothetical protein
MSVNIKKLIIKNCIKNQASQEKRQKILIGHRMKGRRNEKVLE